ncbi:MAG: TrbG/VirB9 family P-type conjugative transfer protein [Sphingosinicella sp.]|nr:TrbG/VirB9 family P-type conjugative transfer protein [Sphingosinicella sp.]
MPLFILAAFALLGQEAPDAPQDQRVRRVPYDAGQVVNLDVRQGYAALVELAPDEAVQNVVVGNSVGWQITPSSGADRIVVKPTAEATVTNMIVVTDVRRYVFLLDPHGGSAEGVFVLRFDYSDPISSDWDSRPPATYKFGGTKSLFPRAMRDDGRRTIITWNDQVELPAIFAVAKGGKEAIVNGRMVGSNLVIDGISPRYIFRLGKAKALASRKVSGSR